jgi:hypothetical protein
LLLGLLTITPCLSRSVYFRVDLFDREPVEPARFAVSQDCWSHSGADADASVRMLIASFSATERPNRLSMAVFWSGGRSLAL